MKLAENSKPTKFIKLDNDHYGTGTGVTLIRKDAFSEIAWNASDSNGYKNRYFGCTLDNFCDGIWPLKLDEKIRECLVPVPIVVAEGNIRADGSVSNGVVCGARFAPRPAFNLKSSIVVSDSTDSDGCYTVESVPGNDGGLYVKNNGLWVRAV